VVAIIGILAAIAIPAYQDYTIRAQVSEGMNLAAAAKAAVAESFLNRGVAPVNRTQAGMSPNAADTVGKYVKSVDVSLGGITIQYGQQANAAIQSKTLQLIPYISADNSISWKCGGAAAPTNDPMPNITVGSGGDLAGTAYVKYLPSACRP
jgi:type IV pilus assembly protein PilA